MKSYMSKSILLISILCITCIGSIYGQHELMDVTNHLNDQNEHNGSEDYYFTVQPRDPFDLYFRFIINEKRNFTPNLISSNYFIRSFPDKHPWKSHSFMQTGMHNSSKNGVTLFTPKLFVSENSNIPRGENDGALWQGVGWNNKFTTGARFRYGPVTAVIRPVLTYSENQEFNMPDVPVKPGLSEFAMPLSNIDNPIRFGENSFTNYDLGDSFVEFDYSGFAVGLSNERIWTGPAIYYPIIFSNNAPGFIHSYIRTSKPFETQFGNFEAKWLWGQLQESDYFDDDDSNNLRYITALIFSYSPSILSGLEVGFTRASYSAYPDNGLRVSDIFQVFKLSQPKPIGMDNNEDSFFSVMSFFGRFHLPEQGFEVYFEWGRNDHRRRFRDILGEVELNNGYVLGFIKRFSITDSNIILLNSEITNLENSTIGSQFREFNIWYTNDSIRQGFTNKGQVIGAGIGPGSTSQLINLAYYHKWGFLGVSAQRIAFHNDRHFRHKDFYVSREYIGFEGAMLTSLHEIEIRYNFSSLIFLPFNVELQADYSIGKIDNLYNAIRNDTSNNRIAITLRYNFPGFLR